MSANYSIDQNTKTLIFTGSPQVLTSSSIKPNELDSFTSVIIPNSVKNIDYAAFCKCSALTSIHIPNSVPDINGQVFAGCSALESCYIPNSVVYLGEWLFSECSALASVHIPNSVTSIDRCVFEKCSLLHKVCLPLNSEIEIEGYYASFLNDSAILRPRLKPILTLQKKSACRATKAAYSIYL